MKPVTRSFAFIGVLFALFLVAGPSYGQFPGMDPALNPMAMMRDTMSNPLMLLSRQEVQKELKLNKSQTEQIKKVKKEQDALIKNYQKAGSGSGDTAQMMESYKKMQASQAELSGKATAVLTSEQKQRLGEIRLQVMGIQAVSDPEVQAAIGATSEQKTLLTSLSSEYTTAKINMMREIKTFKAKQEALDKEFAEKITKVLTADQNAVLNKMAGTPFKDLDKIKTF